jgi:hypothetical protein
LTKLLFKTVVADILIRILDLKKKDTHQLLGYFPELICFNVRTSRVYQRTQRSKLIDVVIRVNTERESD